MLYFFTWNSDFLIKEKIKNWKKLFIEKNWDFNLLHIKDVLSSDKNFLAENLTAASFLAEKKLIIIEWVPFDSEKNEVVKNLETFFENILEKIPDNNIVAFTSLNPDKRWKLYKTLISKAKVEDFNLSWNDDLYRVIDKNFPWKISQKAIDELIKFKSWNIEKISRELEKLLITKNFIEKEDIIEFIIPELEESIFQLIDDILSENILGVIRKMEIILTQTNIYGFYNNLLSNIRTQVYIWKLKSFKLDNNKIKEILNLWNRGFLVTKSYNISYKKLEKLYTDLISIDSKMKSWELIWSEDDDIKLEIEKILIDNLH